MALAIAHHQSAVLGNTIPGTISLGWTPTVGNLIIVFLHCNIATTSITNTANFTVRNTATFTTSTFGQLLNRYVQPGDTSTLPALWSAGSTYWAYEVFEISGVQGNWTADVQATDAVATNTNTNTIASNSIATTSNNVLALMGAGCYDGGSNPTLSSGWTVDEASNNISNYGSQVGGHQLYSTSGTSAQCTATVGNVNDPKDIFLVLLKSQTDASVNLTGTAMSLTAGTLGINTSSSVSLSAAPMTLAARSLAPGSQIPLSGVQMTLEAGDLIHVNIPLSPARMALGFTTLGLEIAPPVCPVAAYSIMRDTPVPAIGAMDDGPVVCVGKLCPSDEPEPFSQAIPLTGVQMALFARTVTPFRNVSARLVGVQMTMGAGTVFGV